MYPPIAANSRVAVEDDIVDVAGRKYVIQAGTHVAWGIFQLQRRTDIWGEDANQWKPSRWLSSEKQTSDKQAAFQAWGFGPRIVSLLFCVPRIWL
jgi:cytochrome P450